MFDNFRGGDKVILVNVALYFSQDTETKNLDVMENCASTPVVRDEMHAIAIILTSYALLDLLY